MLKELFENCLEGPWKTAGEDTQYRIQDRTLYLQCSASGTDWIHNFDFPAIPYKDQPIKWHAHKGFVWAWKMAKEVILKEMFENSVSTIVGYSHGAGLAILAHEDYWYNGGPAATYTFGGPRVLWMSPDISNRFINVTRVSVKGDPVAMLPPLCFGYHHVGVEMKLGDFAFPWWTHHRPIEYMKALEGL